MSEVNLNIQAETKGEKPKYDEWEVKEAVRTVIDAEKIKDNAELMALVAPELDKQAKATKSAAEILYGKTENKENNANV